MLNKRMYFIREHVGFMKMSDTYDILDPETKEQLGIAKEKPGILINFLRFVVNKNFLPTKVFVYTGNDFNDESKLLFSIQRGLTFLQPKVSVHNSDGVLLGWFKRKIFSIRGAFKVFDASGNEIAFVKGDWKGWNFQFLDNAQKEIGTITKKWAGVGKELFTSADNYIISLNEEPTPGKSILLLAAGLAVDVIFKE